jgi:hypothetical protein
VVIYYNATPVVNDARFPPRGCLLGATWLVKLLATKVGAVLINYSSPVLRQCQFFKVNPSTTKFPGEWN